MPDKDDVHKVEPATVLEFLKETHPFKELEESVLDDIATRFTQDFYPNGTVVLKQGESEVTHFHLIQRGGVRILLEEPDGPPKLVDMRGEGSSFGALGLIKQSKANHTVEMYEDTFCYLLDGETFLRLVHTYPKFADYYFQSFSEDMLTAAYAAMRDHRRADSPQTGLYLFNAQVGEVAKSPLEVISASQSVKAAAARMTEASVGSLLVVDQSENILGIITDNDLRTKVVARGLDYTTPVGDIATSPVRTVSDEALCFDALLRMMNFQVHHLGVERDGEIIGMVTAHDIMVQQGISPLSLFREIVAERRIERLYALSEKVPLIVGNLIHEGAKAHDITRMISVLNDHIITRVLSLLQEELGPAPLPWCWLMMGSEGRKEQTFKTDQDNALLYQNPPDDWEGTKEARLYFRRFGNEAIKHLEACGYPLCPGKIMASNPTWRKPYSVWQGYFDRWMAAPEPQAVLHATIFFDFRPAFGTVRLGEQLRDFIAKEAPRRGIFLMHLGKDCLRTKAPLSFFRDFIVEKDGEHKNRIDLKARGLMPFVDVARWLSLKHGIKETGTLARLQAVADAGGIPRDLHAETREAYEFQMQVRLVHQFRRLQAGLQPDNYIDPVDLSESEKKTLKDSFDVINRWQLHIEQELRLT